VLPSSVIVAALQGSGSGATRNAGRRLSGRYWGVASGHGATPPVCRATGAAGKPSACAARASGLPRANAGASSVRGSRGFASIQAVYVVHVLRKLPSGHDDPAGQPPAPPGGRTDWRGPDARRFQRVRQAGDVSECGLSRLVRFRPPDSHSCAVTVYRNTSSGMTARN
jgi:hypothetical protein